MGSLSMSRPVDVAGDRRSGRVGVVDIGDGRCVVDRWCAVTWGMVTVIGVGKGPLR